MRTLITTALLAAAALPALAQAQSYDPRYDHRDVQQDRRDVRDDQRDVQQDRRDLRDDRRDFRDDRRDVRDDRNFQYGHDDWRRYRDQRRDLYARGNWNAPFRYQQFRPGARITPAFYDQRFVIADPWRYHLPPARAYTRYVRHYNDVLLVDYRRGYVVDVIRGFFY